LVQRKENERSLGSQRRTGKFTTGDLNETASRFSDRRRGRGVTPRSPSSAQQAQQVPISIDEHFQDEFWTEQCGFAVFIDIVGDLRVTLVYNQSGLIVRETDHIGGGTFTFRSPDTGKSFSFPSQPSQWDYGAGAVVGSPVVVSFTGLGGHVPGLIPSDAGLFRFLGVVERFDEFGIPLVEFVEVIADRGNRGKRGTGCGSDLRGARRSLGYGTTGAAVDIRRPITMAAVGAGPDGRSTRGAPIPYPSRDQFEVDFSIAASYLTVTSPVFGTSSIHVRPGGIRRLVPAGSVNASGLPAPGFDQRASIDRPLVSRIASPDPVRTVSGTGLPAGSF
jgi:hypothetical protein